MSSKITLYSFIAMFFLLTVTACNTTRGVGQDLEAVGETIADEAEEHK